MFISAFRNHQNFTYIYLLVLTFLLRLIPAFHSVHSEEVLMFEPYMRTFLPVKFDFLSNHMINIGVGALIIYVQALLLNQILSRYNIFSKPTMIPALLYVMISSMFIEFLSIQPVMIVNFIVLLLLERIFAMYKTDKPIARAFDLGLIIAAGTFIYFPFIVLLPLVWIGLAVFLPFSWRSWLSGLMGFLILYFFIAVYYFYTDNLDGFIRIFQPFDLQFRARLDIPLLALINLLPLVLILTLSISYYRVNYHKNGVQVRKSLQFLLFLIVLSGIGFYLQPFLVQYSGQNISAKPRYTLLHFMVWTVPLSVYSSYFFIFAEKKWMYEGLFIIWLGGIIFFQIH